MVLTCEKRNAYRVLERKYLQEKHQLVYLGIDVMTNNIDFERRTLEDVDKIHVA